VFFQGTLQPDYIPRDGQAEWSKDQPFVPLFESAIVGKVLWGRETVGCQLILDACFGASRVSGQPASIHRSAVRFDAVKWPEVTRQKSL
jgi:hypothetical protein